MSTEVPDALRCPACSVEFPPTFLCCPSCHHLVHSGRLKEIATLAREATAAGRPGDALRHWREALGLLPGDSSQARSIRETISGLTRRIDAAPAAGAGTGAAAPAGAGVAPGDPGRGGRRGLVAGSLGALGLLAWKLKSLLLVGLTKVKYLFTGLTKSSTAFSMLLSFGVYWTAWGWSFALGLVLSIYVHEIGHVVALTRYGIPATAPMFIPGLGAVVRIKHTLADAREDAHVGLAGPIWGLGAAVATGLVHLATGWPLAAALTRVGAWINLFNLLPVWQLDGSRGLRVLSRTQRVVLLGVVAACWAGTGEGLLVLVALALGARLWIDGPGGPGDRTILAWFAGLLVTLCALTCLPVEVGPGR